VTSTGPAPAPWWDRDRLADRRRFLRLRQRIITACRDWFGARDFVEVETSVLQVSPGNETHLHAPRAVIHTAGGVAQTRYLRTSPEFSCKKLLAAGEPRLFEFARVFRDRESGPLHLPEFTMLEWYRAGESYDAVMADCLALIAVAARACEATWVAYRGQPNNPFAPPERLTLAEAFARYASIDLLASVAADGTTDRDAFAQAAHHAGIRVTDDDTWSDIFSKVLVAKIEPKLGIGPPTVLYEYPVPEAALARVCRHDPRVAERFEVYICGVELANGFGELVDAAEQRRRFAAAMDEKERRYGERYPIDADFLAALIQMPQASGVALGFDRLVMLAVNAMRIDQVVWQPPENRDA
jgi:lysyl-tRNA synthetase class 2